MSRVTCHVSHVMCHMSQFFLSIFLSIFFGQSGEAYRWMVCYQRGLPRLVFITNYVYTRFTFCEVGIGNLDFIICTIFIRFMVLFKLIVF